MKKIKFIAALTFTLLCSVNISNAQYYSWGADRASLKWSTIEGEGVKVLFPNEVETTARQTLHYIDAVQPYIGYGLDHSAMEIPFVLRSENFASNGLVMWMPKRIEFLTSPSLDGGFSMPWIKQLVAHEYRHAAQYNNINQSTMKWVRYILGQQGAVIGLAFPSLYAIEGDAVMTETQMTTFGRALQPSFTIGYRAIGKDLIKSKRSDKWFCGSYKEHVPDHYSLGYQIVSHAYAKYDQNIWNKVFEYSARNPFFFFPQSIALNKYYNTSSGKLFQESFTALNNLWEALPYTKNTTKILSNIDKTNYTTYSHPIDLGNNKILSLKKDYNDPSRFVIFSTQNKDEEFVAYTGVVSTRPSYGDGRVWWSEYRRSALFNERIFSTLCYMDLDDEKPQTYKGIKNAIYPTVIDNSKNHIAYVEYLPSGEYSVVELKDGVETARTQIEYPKEIHDLAWDNQSKELYIIVTDDDGMYIAKRDVAKKNFSPITKGAYVTISNLRAHDGKLYFGSIMSGKDEAHCYDIAQGKEYQITNSKFGSFQPSANSSSNEIVLTTYDRYGYHLSKQSIDKDLKEVKYSNVPKNIVNIERERWNVINLDTLKFDAKSLEQLRSAKPKKRYSKVGHIFNVHSWAPASFNPYKLIAGEMDFDLNFGATLLSQNLLSSCDGYLAYGWNRNLGSIVKGAVNYDGLGVNLGVSASYGGPQNIYLFEENPIEEKTYRDVTLSATLPLYFQRGYRTKQLSFSSSWNYSNGVIPKIEAIKYNEANNSLVLLYDQATTGLNKLSFGVGYSSYGATAYRDVALQNGYTLSAAYAFDPTNKNFSHLATIYGRVYTPGFAKNNSLSIAAAYQTTFKGLKYNGYSILGYNSSVLCPRGYELSDISNRNYIASSVDYQFPLCYPEGGIESVLYIKRIRMNIGADYAQYQLFNSSYNRLYSYGADFIFDFNIFRMPAASTSTFKVSIYKPKDRNVYFQVGIGLPI